MSFTTKEVVSELLILFEVSFATNRTEYVPLRPVFEKYAVYLPFEAFQASETISRVAFGSVTFALTTETLDSASVAFAPIKTAAP